MENKQKTKQANFIAFALKLTATFYPLHPYLRMFYLKILITFNRKLLQLAGKIISFPELKLLFPSSILLPFCYAMSTKWLSKDSNRIC